MNIDKFYALLKNPALLNIDSLPAIAEMVEAHPYAANFRVLYLLNLLQLKDYKAQEQLPVAAMYIGDRARLKHWVEYIKKPQNASAAQSSLKHSQHKNNKVALLQLLRKRMQAIEQQKAKEEQMETVPKQQLIERFLAAQPSISRVENKDFYNPQQEAIESSKDDTSNLVSETLVDIYIQQGLISKAIESLQKLILKYPEKSTYFAARINELNKNVKNG